MRSGSWGVQSAAGSWTGRSRSVASATATTAEIPATILKGAGIDLFSIGRSAAQAGDEIVVDSDPDPAAPSYRRLVSAGQVRAPTGA